MTALRRLDPRLALLLLAAALLTRALLPAGWMPAADAGGLRIALCGGDGAMLTLARDGTIERAPAGKGPVAEHESCPFGVPGGSALLPRLAVLLAPVLPALAPDAAAVRAFALSLPARLRPPLRAPPLPA